MKGFRSGGRDDDLGGEASICLVYGQIARCRKTNAASIKKVVTRNPRIA